MNWVEGIRDGIQYIEEHLEEEITIEDVAKHVCISSFYYQKAFSILCGFSVSEYIRYRRLSLAGSDLLATNQKIIDIAMKYGYDSPDSFTKAFTRFHGVTPTVVRREKTMIKSFAPLKIQLTLKGGSTMDYKIIEKEAFTVIGVSRCIDVDTAFQEIPQFWNEHFQDNDTQLNGLYGVCIDDENKHNFKYMIADNYHPEKEIPEGLETHIIPRLTWAVFPCKGPLPKALQDVNQRIFSEWLPNNNTYEISEHYNIEMYSDCKDFSMGNHDENYYSEIWIPVKKK